MGHSNHAGFLPATTTPSPLKSSILISPQDLTSLANFNDSIRSFDIGVRSSTIPELQVVVPASRIDTASQ
jgi:hypothetical protein